jgi:hypothetical protein
MKTIYKYAIDTRDLIKIDMPVGAEILSLQTQKGEPCLWALVDTEAPKEVRVFEIYGTGHPVDDDPKKFLGTFQLRGGDLIFHVFEKIS